MHDPHPAKKNLLILYSYWPDTPILSFNLNFQNIQKLTKRRDDDQIVMTDSTLCAHYHHTSLINFDIFLNIKPMVLRSDQGC